MAKNRKPNWSKWALIPDTTVLNLVALSLDIEPESVEEIETESREFQDRVAVVCANVGKHPALEVTSLNIGDPLLHQLTLRKFRKYAESNSWSYPDQLPGEPVDSALECVDPEKWLRRDLWSATEFRDLLCGLEPNFQRVNIRETGEALEEMMRAVTAKILIPVPMTYPADGDYPGRMNFYFAPREAIIWADRKKLLFPKFPFDEASIAQHPEPEKKWPWGDHNTRLLSALADAAKKFWSLYDPTDPTTAPTSDSVREWLIKDREVPKRVAEAMAQMLRADGLRTGPRKQLSARNKLQN